MTSLRFGDAFELDLRAYELRRGGRAIRLERIPMEILLLLVERPSDLVTREQIAERIWGRDVFGDTDNSINGAIHKIRQALKDDPENPRFILTVTGRGYRFIAPLVADETSPPAPPAAATPEAGAPAPRTSWPSVLLATLVLAGSVGMLTLWRRPERPRTAAGRVMLAVLPFENLTGDPGQDYFSDGFTEEMITRLGTLAPQRLGVIARTSVMRYKKGSALLDQLGRDLGVQYALEGSVRRGSDRVRITAQLIRLEDQTHVWAREYDREQADILGVQEEIAGEIADQVDLALGDPRHAPARPVGLSPKGYEAYDHYLRGLYLLNKRTKEGFQGAIGAFQDAVADNPRDARAYAGLANAYTLMANYALAPEAETIPKAREAALAALATDDALSAAHTSLALINEFHDRDWQSAGEQFRRAIELDANDATAHHWYAEYLCFQGRFDEALAEIAVAHRLDPLSLIIAADEGAILYFARQYDRAIVQFRSVLAAEPTFGRAHHIIFAYAQLGRFDEALNQIQEWKKVEDGPWLGSGLAHVYGRLGRIEEARRALREMEESNRRWKEDPYLMRATAYVGMGLNEEALASLQDACERRSTSQLVMLKVEPMFDPLRADARFQDLLRCAHLSP